MRRDGLSDLSAPLLAAKAYFAYAPDAPDPPPDEAIDPTPAHRAAVRRTLSRLQKRGLVVKLGNMYPDERCSYADREHTLAIVRKSDCNRSDIIRGEFKNCVPTRLRARHEPTNSVRVWLCPAASVLPPHLR
jgi:hypothetical protein